MKIESLQISMKVRHPQYGVGTVKSIGERTAEIRFDDGTKTIAPEASDLQPAEAQVAISGLEQPLGHFIRETARAVVAELGLEKPESFIEQLGVRWHRGKMVLHPADPTLQTKEVPLEVFFHKIVMMRNNLRSLEQRINSSENLTEAERFDWQAYITRCYGSMSTFNVLFRTKEGQFNSKGSET
jgi:hypothetical protein